MKRFLFITFFVILSFKAFSQITVNYPDGKKLFYHQGDTIHLTVVMKLSSQSCLEGMRKTYLYYSGCKDLVKTQWSQCPNNIFRKYLVIQVTADAGKKAKVTITRDTDKESFFRQETFIIK